jgi:hypothetical protein
MPPLKHLFAGLIEWPVFVGVLGPISLCLVVIVIALRGNDYVKADVSLRSFGFTLETKKKGQIARSRRRLSH